MSLTEGGDKDNNRAGTTTSSPPSASVPFASSAGGSDDTAQRKREKEKGKRFRYGKDGEKDPARDIADSAATDFAAEVSAGIDAGKLTNIFAHALAVFVDPYHAALLRDVNFGKGPLDNGPKSYREPWGKHTPTPMSTNISGASGITGLIGRAESHGGDACIWNGGARLPLTTMTVDEVIAQQARWREIPGATSSAAGKYQIIRSTLTSLKKEMGLSGNELFDEAMQDRMGIQLMCRRGLNEYLAGNISTEQFMKKLSKEWAGLPKDMGGRSYYAGVGNNGASVSPHTVVAALEEARAKYQTSQQLASAEIGRTKAELRENAAEVTGSTQVAAADSTGQSPSNAPTAELSSPA